MKTLVVFYSRTGNTKKIAEILAKKLHADIDEIVDLKNRKGVIGFIFGGRDAMKQSLTKITVSKNPRDYDLVVIGTPIWVGASTPAFRTYLTNYKKDIKKVAVFATSGGDTVDKTVTVLENILDKKSIASVGWTNAEINQGKIDDKIDSFLINLKK